MVKEVLLAQLYLSALPGKVKLSHQNCLHNPVSFTPPGSVEHMEWLSTKTSQGKIGEYASQRNIKVFPKAQRTGSAMQYRFIEFSFLHG